MTEPTGKAKGGVARAKLLSEEERKAIAKKAAAARWENSTPQATHEGEFKIGDASILAAVLPGGRRVLTQATFLRALGRSRSPKGGTGVLSTVDGVPFFLQAEVLKPFINSELAASTAPVFYREKNGKKAVGYVAELLPAVAEVYLQMRDSLFQQGKPIPSQYSHIIRACDATMRGLARVGIVALVDEATGYQEVRDRQALQQILDTYLTAEKAKWAKTFPDEFYKRLFAVRGLPYDPTSSKRPGFIGKDTNDIVYDRLAPGILKKLHELNPKTDKGHRSSKHHQFFTKDYGLPELQDHVKNVMFLMKSAGNGNFKQFKVMLDRAAPRQGSTLTLDLDEPN
ncbi:MAG: P63C domain-containing protein [Rhodocyclaceae bacterium]|nr:P63C domain-containing protein [Rhodocyclaceae bacterium]